MIASLACAGCDRIPETYEAACHTPSPGWGTEADGIGHLLPFLSIVLAADGTLRWGRASLSNDALRTYLDRAGHLSPAPQIVLEVSPAARCDRVREVRAIMDRAPICRGPHSRCSEGRDPARWHVAGGP